MTSINDTSTVTLISSIFDEISCCNKIHSKPQIPQGFVVLYALLTSREETTRMSGDDGRKRLFLSISKWPQLHLGHMIYQNNRGATADHVLNGFCFSASQRPQCSWQLICSSIIWFFLLRFTYSTVLYHSDWCLNFSATKYHNSNTHLYIYFKC